MHTFLITHLPVPRDDEEAWDWIDSLEESNEPIDSISEPKFLNLIDILLARYPEDFPQDQWEKIVWAEGPLRRCGTNNILYVSVSGRHLNIGAQELLVQSARSLGLTSFDTESNEIHRA
jgi:hypothetical protein